MMLPLAMHRDCTGMVTPAFREGVQNSAYHALPGLSSSVLKAIAQGAVADIWWRSVEDKAPSPEKELGRAAHTLVLEPHRWTHDVHVLPADTPKTGKKRGEMVQAAQAAGAEAVIVEDQAHTALCIALAVQAHDGARRLLDACEYREPTLTWRHESGHALRVRPDALSVAEPRLGDLKTSAPREGNAHTARSWRGTVLRLGYHISAAMYRDVVRRVTGIDPGPMVWIVASTKPPYTVSLFECGANLESLGRSAYQRAIERYDRWYREAKVNGEAWAGAEMEIETVDVRGEA